MQKPLVSVICLCYNQARFVLETLESVVAQDYALVEMIIVDDASEDGSKELIDGFLERYPDVPYVDIKFNVGNTTAFNQGLKLATGKYVIDLACDDLLVPNRISEQVEFFEEQSENVGVIYSDAVYISEKGKETKRHFQSGQYEAYEGDVYLKLIDTYFVPPPTMMIRKYVLDHLGGYDKELAYEDFDFWIRSSRDWGYAYQDQVLTRIRRVKNSHSDTLYKYEDKKVASTVLVCQKIRKLNRSELEDEALARRLRYEIRHAFLTGCRQEVEGFMKLLIEIDKSDLFYKCLRRLNFGINLSVMRQMIHWVKYAR
ncbi:glycosyltransferase [Reichenbachiella sp. MSK19-1]|uniref:glycosyltransferase n=1 Tax=Reichenbachiella sp. MSK19-1 TaxID=1897631 RepID=UPI000E6B8A56|nr:glycosyltransferase [Reichenbachiella sp. MSK19-1]RJE72073.1 hypothetical protein BGP76_08345 [Reichenbachiella sp. MSK19-1]